MEFEWDAAKNHRNLRKHGVSFEYAARAFDGTELTITSDRDGEVRFHTFGAIDGRVYAIAWTDRSGVIRIISARKASVRETRRYLQSRWR